MTRSWRFTRLALNSQGPLKSSYITIDRISHIKESILVVVGNANVFFIIARCRIWMALSVVYSITILKPSLDSPTGCFSNMIHPELIIAQLKNGNFGWRCPVAKVGRKLWILLTNPLGGRNLNVVRQHFEFRSHLVALFGKDPMFHIVPRPAAWKGPLGLIQYHKRQKDANGSQQEQPALPCVGDIHRRHFLTTVQVKVWYTRNTIPPMSMVW